MRRLAIQAMIDLRVGAAETDAQHFHRDLVRLHFRIRHVAHVDRVFLARLDDDRFHDVLLVSWTVRPRIT
jgi:hypothetical protein